MRFKLTAGAGLLAAVGLLAMPLAPRAETGLVHYCVDGPGFTTTPGELCPLRGWARPADDLAILTCAEPTAADCRWGGPTLEFRTWGDVPASYFAQTCDLDVPVGPFADPNVDPCGSARANKPYIQKSVLEPVVVADGTARIDFEWMRPTERFDGTPLPVDEIARYSIYYGTASRAYSDQVDIENGAVLSRRLDIPLDGDTRLFFAMTATDTDGRESEWSNEESLLFVFEEEETEEPSPPTVPQEIEVTITCTSSDPRVVCRLVSDP